MGRDQWKKSPIPLYLVEGWTFVEYVHEYKESLFLQNSGIHNNIISDILASVGYIIQIYRTLRTKHRFVTHKSE